MSEEDRRCLSWVAFPVVALLVAGGCADDDLAADVSEADAGADVDASADADAGSDVDAGPDDADGEGDAADDADGDAAGTVRGYVVLQGEVDHSAASVVIDGTSLTDDSDGTGAWSIAGVSAGTYTVTASRAGFASTTSNPFEVRAGETTTVPPLTLDATTGSLSGTALLADGSDHSGIVVAVEGTSHAATTDAAGTWSIVGVTVGNYAVRASRTGYVDATATDQEVRAAQNTTVPTLTLQLPSHSIVYVSGGSVGGNPAQTATVGTALAQPFVVRVLDPMGAGASEASVTFTVEAGGGTASPSSAFTDSEGYAQTTLTVGTTAGANRVVARTDLVAGQSVAFAATGTAAAPDHLTVEGDGQTGTVGQALANPLAVVVLDQYENPVPGRQVTFAPGPGGGSAAPPSATTGVDGRAATTWTLGTVLDTTTARQTLLATVTGTALEHAFEAVTHSDTPATMTKVSGDAQNWHAEAPLPEPLVVRVEDAHGNPAYGWNVSWSTSDGGSFAPVSSPVGLDGLAFTVATTGPASGSQRFTATVEALDVTFTAVLKRHHIDDVFPGRVGPEWPIDMTVEITGGGFDPDAVVVWNVGGAEATLTPSTVEAGRIVVTLTSDRFALAGTFPITVSQADSGRCTAFDFVVGPVLPDTGQTLCFENVTEIPCPAPGTDFYGQDPQFGWDLFVTRAQRFERSVPVTYEPVVVDRITRLEWQGCVGGLNGSTCWNGTASHMSHADAIAYCEALNWGGHDDWRLPNVRELSSVILLGLGSGAIDPSAFPNDPMYPCWSSTQSTGFYRWAVSFRTGAPQREDRYSSDLARCVRGGPMASLSFEPLTASGDRLVMDDATGLIWQGCAAGQSGGDCTGDTATRMTWQAALAFCDGLSWGGYDDWRLPNRNELQSIVDYGRTGPAIDLSAFPGTPADWLWSSSSTPWGDLFGYIIPSDGWGVDFNLGLVSSHSKASTLHVRCVRRGP